MIKNKNLSFLIYHNLINNQVIKPYTLKEILNLYILTTNYLNTHKVKCLQTAKTF